MHRCLLQSLGCGKGMRTMLEALREGEPPPDVYQAEERYDGNAALIRLAPVPVVCWSRSPQACLELARASARATQNGPAAADAAAFLAFDASVALWRRR